VAALALAQNIADQTGATNGTVLGRAFLDADFGKRAFCALEPTSRILQPLSRTELAAKFARPHRFEGG
jgi:hypothetical protein